MKGYKSPLILNNFFILNLEYNFVQPSENVPIDVNDLMDSYDIDLDFAFHSVEDDKIQLFTKIGVNKIEKPSAGYVLFIEGICIFSFKKEIQLPENEKSQLLNFSGLNICINSLRNILSIITANGPLGRYTLPSIDVNLLLDQKHKLSK